MNVLVTVDLQEGFRERATLAILPRIHELCDTMPQAEHIVSMEFFSNPNDRYEKELQWTLLQDPSQRELLNEFNLPHGAERLTHDTYDLTPTLLSQPWAHKVENWFLCGVYTNICIQLSALTLFDHNQSVYVVTDACATLHGHELHEAALQLMSRSLNPDKLIHTKRAIELLSAPKN